MYFFILANVDMFYFGPILHVIHYKKQCVNKKAKFVSFKSVHVFTWVHVFRVRDLSSGDSGAAAPPNTPPPRKYKLAEFRYGREEMLALLAEDYEIPLGLKDFEDIINERPVQPLAFVDVSEEEEVRKPPLPKSHVIVWDFRLFLEERICIIFLYCLFFHFSIYTKNL